MGLNYRPKSGYGKVDLSASGNNLAGDNKKFTADSIYRAPYFDLSHFNKKGVDGGAEVTTGRQQHQKKPATQRSRDGGGSNISHSRRGTQGKSTTVDRAVGYGKDLPSYLLPREKDPRDREKERLERAQQRDGMAGNQKLATMFDETLFQRLDKTFIENPSHSFRQAPPPLIERTDPKGGVVVL